MKCHRATVTPAGTPDAWCTGSYRYLEFVSRGNCAPVPEIRALCERAYIYRTVWQRQDVILRIVNARYVTVSIRKTPEVDALASANALLIPLASGRSGPAAFPRRSFLAPQSRQRRALWLAGTRPRPVPPSPVPLSPHLSPHSPSPIRHMSLTLLTVPTGGDDY
jgi:hypothetical protein